MSSHEERIQGVVDDQALSGPVKGPVERKPVLLWADQGMACCLRCLPLDLPSTQVSTLQYAASTVAQDEQHAREDMVQREIEVRPNRVQD